MGRLKIEYLLIKKFYIFLFVTCILCFNFKSCKVIEKNEINKNSSQSEWLMTINDSLKLNSNHIMFIRENDSILEQVFLSIKDSVPLKKIKKKLRFILQQFLQY